MNNAELIAALRICGNFADRDGCDEACPYYNDKDCPKRIMCDAADALEAAERLLDQNTERCEALRKQLREAHESYEKHLNELEAQLPKEGEWIPVGDGTVYVKCSVCGEEMCCRGHYCPNCGARMRGEQE